MAHEEMVASSLSFLMNAVKFVENDTLRDMCYNVLKDTRFCRCPAARLQHQSYDGGLVVHTAEVLDLAVAMARTQFIDINHDVLITATVFHDYGKIFDYQPRLPTEDPKNNYSYTDHQKLIRHLSRSYAMFMQASEGVDEGLRTRIGHVILAHHGRKEWGSPVEPVLNEAYILHFADMLSANCSREDYSRMC